MERRTWSPKLAETLTGKRWYIVDAEGQTLGRLASVIAATLRGKNKPTFSPHMDMGDYVIVINAEKVAVTGKKEIQKEYFRHSGYPGGLRRQNLKEVRAAHPERIIEGAVRGMLPKNVLGEKQFRKLKVYVGSEHPHVQQKPESLAI